MGSELISSEVPLVLRFLIAMVTFDVPQASDTQVLPCAQNGRCSARALSTGNCLRPFLCTGSVRVSTFLSLLFLSPQHFLQVPCTVLTGLAGGCEDRQCISDAVINDVLGQAFSLPLPFPFCGVRPGTRLSHSPPPSFFPLIQLK